MASSKLLRGRGYDDATAVGLASFRSDLASLPDSVQERMLAVVIASLILEFREPIGVFVVKKDGPTATPSVSAYYCRLGQESVSVLTAATFSTDFALRDDYSDTSDLVPSEHLNSASQGRSLTGSRWTVPQWCILVGPCCPWGSHGASTSSRVWERS